MDMKGSFQITCCSSSCRQTKCYCQVYYLFQSW